MNPIAPQFDVRGINQGSDDDGDTVFLTPREARPQDIGARFIDGESTLKRFLVQRGRPFLRAENPRYPDLLPAAELIMMSASSAHIPSEPAAD